MIKDVYEECPVYKKQQITLRKINMEDAEDLLKCYSDGKAVPFFNSDNCHGDNFHYTTIERMKKAIEDWTISYNSKYYVRWTVKLNSTNEKIGTIEMFHRIADDEFNHFGLLRIDLQSKFESKSIISEILEIANENFYEAFDVKAILTKAISSADERIASLIEKGYHPVNKKVMLYDDYFERGHI